MYSKSNHQEQRAQKNKAHKRQNTASNYSFLLYQTLHTIVATLAPMIRQGVNVKVTPLRVHLYSKSNQ